MAMTSDGQVVMPMTVRLDHEGRNDAIVWKEKRTKINPMKKDESGARHFRIEKDVRDNDIDPSLGRCPGKDGETRQRRIPQECERRVSRPAPRKVADSEELASKQDRRDSIQKYYYPYTAEAIVM